MQLIDRSPLPAPSPLPKHVAVIMDGNRRWARRRLLPVAEGYRRGIASLRELTRACRDYNIPLLTAYGFSTENWKRDADEVNVLFDICSAFARNEAAGMRADGVCVRTIGDIEALPRGPREALAYLVEETRGCTGVTLNLAVNYSGRAEMREAVRALARDVRGGVLEPDAIGDEAIAARLYTAGLPDPDLLIRPGGECRISNFLLYQVAYTELWMTDVQWPDFDRSHLEAALVAYQQRQRRFGGR